MPQLFAEPTQRTLSLVSLARRAQFLRMAWRIDEQVVRGELDNRWGAELFENLTERVPHFAEAEGTKVLGICRGKFLHAEVPQG